MVVGGQFTQVRNYGTSTTLTRSNLLAFDATTGISSSFAPDPFGTVYKVLPAADGKSAYVAGSSALPAAGMSGRLFKIDVTTGGSTPTFTPPAISGEIRDLELVGNHLFLAGKFTHINGIRRRPSDRSTPTTGARDPYVVAGLAGEHNPPS